MVQMNVRISGPASVPDPSNLNRQGIMALPLFNCPLFADLNLDDWRALAAIAKPKSLDKDAFLFWEGTPVRGFFVVVAGAIKLHRLNGKGQEQVFHVFRPVESLAEECILSGENYSADASATEASKILLFPKAEVIALLNSRPGIALRLLRSVSQRVRSLMDVVDDLRLKDARTRLANWLIQHCPRPDSTLPQPVHLRMTKRLLASELGITSETLSRTLAKFREHQLVRVDGRVVTLTCPMRLAQAA